MPDTEISYPEQEEVSEEEIEQLLESDDESGDENRVGNVPSWWYEDFDHVGYSAKGEKVQRKMMNDEISKFLRKADDPEWWKKIYDEKNQKITELSEEDLKIIRRIMEGNYPLESFDPHSDFFTYEEDFVEDAVHPTISKRPVKSTFLPSEGQRKRITKFLKMIKAGILNDDDRKRKIPNYNYDLWKDAVLEEPLDDSRKVRSSLPLPAPKRPRPGHEASYSPPEEYLFNDEEKKLWEDKDPSDRQLDFIPEKFTSLRRVPAYKNLVAEAYKWMMDLLLLPRKVEEKLNLSSEELLPKLPSKDQLRPYPSRIGIEFRSGGPSVIHCAFDPQGNYVVLHDTTQVVDIHDCRTGQLVSRLGPFSFKVTALQWHPTLPILTIGIQSGYILLVCLVLPDNSEPSFTASDEVPIRVQKRREAESLLSKESDQQHWRLHFTTEELVPENQENYGPLENLDISTLKDQGCSVLLSVQHNAVPTSIQYHPKGNYICVTCPEAGSPGRHVQLHSLAKKTTYRPLRHQVDGGVQMAGFHPTKAYVYTMTSSCVSVLDLAKREKESAEREVTSKAAGTSSVIYKFKGRQGMQCVDYHPGGEHLAVGCGGGKLLWFDHELGKLPYKILQSCDENFSVSFVKIHKKYPLTASCNSNGNVTILHTKVFTDFITNPLLVPIKTLRDPLKPVTDRNVSASWHPTQPWLLTGFTSGSVYLWV
eukprot:GHVP01025524.1.p1 GENE.GHVP01025524.1~~GHVP01025524.1.p1  ORF type:complete len:713 (+),score=97.59 GHVP01025524.1:25-2139(+)